MFAPLKIPGLVYKMGKYFIIIFSFIYFISLQFSNIKYSFQNFRFWGIKYLLVIGGIIGAFFIPQGDFGVAWMYFGMIGGFLFIIIQLVLIVDFAHSWADLWIGMLFFLLHY
jgi:hypothetical protein